MYITAAIFEFFKIVGHIGFLWFQDENVNIEVDEAEYNFWYFPYSRNMLLTNFNPNLDYREIYENYSYGGIGKIKI